MKPRLRLINGRWICSQPSEFGIDIESGSGFTPIMAYRDLERKMHTPFIDIRPFQVSDYLDSQEVIDEYINAARESGNHELVKQAIEDAKAANRVSNHADS